MFAQITEYLSTASPHYLKVICELFTILAETYVIIIVCTALYWCKDRTAGRRLALTVAGGLCINAFIKNIFRVPRVFSQSENVTVTREQTATGYSFPSGHTQNASTVGGSLAYYFKKRILTVVFFAYALLVAFSRLVLGVHYLPDVLVALILGFSWAYLSSRLFDKIEKSRRNIGFLLYLLPAALSLLTLLRAGAMATQVHDLLAGVGLSIGLVLGVPLEKKYVEMSTGGSPMRRALRLISGLAAIGVIMGIFSFLPHGNPVTVLKYSVVGFAAAVIIPLGFKKFRI